MNIVPQKIKDDLFNFHEELKNKIPSSRQNFHILSAINFLYAFLINKDEKTLTIHLGMFKRMLKDNIQNTKNIKHIEENIINEICSLNGSNIVGGLFNTLNTTSIFTNIKNKRNLLCNVYNTLHNLNEEHICLKNECRKIGGSNTTEIKKLRDEIAFLEQQKEFLKNEYIRLFNVLKCTFVRTVNLLIDGKTKFNGGNKSSKSKKSKFKKSKKSKFKKSKSLKKSKKIIK